jgi:hypothetical protein
LLAMVQFRWVGNQTATVMTKLTGVFCAFFVAPLQPPWQ